jgi:hypothetical protein
MTKNDKTMSITPMKEIIWLLRYPDIPIKNKTAMLIVIPELRAKNHSRYILFLTVSIKSQGLSSAFIANPMTEQWRRKAESIRHTKYGSLKSCIRETSQGANNFDK